MLSRGLILGGKSSHIQACERIAAECSRLRPSSRYFQNLSGFRISFRSNIHTCIAFSCILRIGVVTHEFSDWLKRIFTDGRRTCRVMENGGRVKLRFCARLITCFFNGLNHIPVRSMLNTERFTFSYTIRVFLPNLCCIFRVLATKIISYFTLTTFCLKKN
jgi:hypothetical protein